MKYLLFRILAIGLVLFSSESCGKVKNGAKHVWVAREDNGDKPGVEYRIWIGANGDLAGEMWLFVVDEAGKDKERGQYPTTITASDQTSLAFDYKSGDESIDQIRIRFPRAPSEPQELGMIEDLSNSQTSKLLFTRISPASK